MLTDLTNIPEDLTQETSLNGKYLKGIDTIATDPDVNVGNADHTHSSDGDHGHAATVDSHSHTGVTPSGGGQNACATGANLIQTTNHTHNETTNTQAVAEASNDGDHTHDTKSNDLEHRTITFYKKTNISIGMSRKALPRNMTFFYSKTGTLPAGLLENLNYVDKHFKGDVTPGTEAGSNTHQHDNQTHDHPTDISDHEHSFTFGGQSTSTFSNGSGSSSIPWAPGSHGHGAGTAATTGKNSTPVTSGLDAGHAHDDISHEPTFKTLRLMEVNSVKMSNVGVPKNCIFLWLDTIILLGLVSGWQVSDGNNDTIDMLDVIPKGSSTPGTTGGLVTHTHSEDAVSHAHSGADVIHGHSGVSGSPDISATSGNATTGGSVGIVEHNHGLGVVDDTTAQPVTITNGASNHDHGAISNDPDAKTIAFIERNNL